MDLWIMKTMTWFRTGWLVCAMSLGFFTTGVVPLLAAGSDVWALNLSHPKYRLQMRRNAAGQDDRKEGIEPVKISGEHLELTGAFLNVSALSSGASDAAYHLGFYLKEEESRVDIRVRDYDIFRDRQFI